MTSLDKAFLVGVVKTALAEDIGHGDITSEFTIPPDTAAKAKIVCKDRIVIAGMPVVEAVFLEAGVGIALRLEKRDGERADAGDTLASLSGPARCLLAGERVALNFLQRLSGIATLTARYVELVAGTKARIVDTRKTTPGLRRLEKYAVTVGGGFNHRFGLSDGILIKDNHIAVAGGVTAAVEAAKRRAPHTLKIEVEVDSLDKLKEAIDAGADAVMLDNMSVRDMREAVALAAGRVVLEASGGVNESNVREVAETGVDIISVGALTHSARAVDISMDIVTEHLS